MAAQLAEGDPEKGPGKKEEVAISESPVHSVVVYPDRAEVRQEVVYKRYEIGAIYR